MARTPCRVSHDLRGVINIVRGRADLAREKLDPDHPAAVDIARIVRACKEAGALMLELRSMTYSDAA